MKQQKIFFQNNPDARDQCKKQCVRFSKPFNVNLLVSNLNKQLYF